MAEEVLSRGLRPELGCFVVPLRDSPGLETSMPFSPCRSSHGRHSAYLLRAVAQLRSQLRAHLLRAPPAPSQRRSAWRWVGGVLLGPVVLSKCPRLGLVALCEAEEAPPACSRPYVGESRFNWKLFWQFLRPHLLVLGTAIVVRCPSPFPHIRDREGASQVCELHGDSLPASPSLRIDFRKQQGLAGLGTGSQGIPGDPAQSSWVCRVQGSPGAGSLDFNSTVSKKHRSSQSMSSCRGGRAKVKARDGEEDGPF